MYVIVYMEPPPGEGIDIKEFTNLKKQNMDTKMKMKEKEKAEIHN
jgi:hypothetical protein